MSSKQESDVCCRLQVALSGESYEGKRRPGRKQWQTTAGSMAWFTSRHLRADCLYTPGSAPGPTLGNEYGKTLPLPLHRRTGSRPSKRRPALAYAHDLSMTAFYTVDEPHGPLSRHYNQLKHCSTAGSYTVHFGIFFYTICFSSRYATFSY